MIRPLLLLMAAASLSGSPSARSMVWNVTLSPGSDGGPVLGNPAARNKLVVYTSYTCPKCARFAIDSLGALRIAYIPTGKLSLEIRHLVRDPVDRTVAILVQCGSRERFFPVHLAMMRAQASWQWQLERAPAAQRQRWSTADPGQRSRAIASDLHLYEIMQSQGYDRIATDRCLTDKSLAAQIDKQAAHAISSGLGRDLAVLLNGKPLGPIQEWNALKPQIDASL